MDGTKALEGMGSGMVGGRPDHEMDLDDIEVSRKSNKQFSSWIDRLTGQKEQRRGSIGFTDHSINLSVPLTRYNYSDQYQSSFGVPMTRYNYTIL